MTFRTAGFTAALFLLLVVPAGAQGASPGQPHADQGAELFRVGEYRAARDAFREAVRLDPSLLKSWENLGWAKHRLGNTDEALRLWKDLLRLAPEREETLAAIDAVTAEQQRAEQHRTARSPSPAAALAREGDAAFARGDHVAAERAYREALSSSPDDALLLTRLGRAVHASGRTADAVAIWSRAAAVPDAPAQVFRHLAEGQLELKDVDGAERSLGKLLAAPAIDARWALIAAQLLVKHGAAERGAAWFTSAVPETVPGRARALSLLLTSEAAAAAGADRSEDAAPQLERAIALDPGNRAALRDLGQAYARLGRATEAEQTWKEYARRYPELTEPHDLLARSYLSRQAYDEALAACRASRAIDRDQKRARVCEVRSLFGLSRFGEARPLAAELAAQLPDDVQTQHLFAEALTKCVAYRDAARQWARVLELDPTSEKAKQNRVRTLYEAGQVDEAVREARALAEEAEPIPAVLELLALDASVRQELSEAVAWYERLTRRVPEVPQHWRSLSSLLGKTGRFEQQLAVAREALRRMPDRVELRLDVTDALQNVGRLEEALAVARAVLREFPDNRLAHAATVQLLTALGRGQDALLEVSRAPASFYKDDDRRILEARLRAGLSDFSSAMRVLEPVAMAPPSHREIPILVYHGVVDAPRTVQTTRAAYDAQMAALAARGYQAITLTELARMLDGELPMPQRPILITFDDARGDSFAMGDPALAKHGFKATMFVPTGIMGPEDGFRASWDTLRRYAGTGRWDLQAHGHDAHVPVRIDEAGQTGEFLVRHAWLTAERRVETTPEFLARIDQDHRRCKATLDQLIPGSRALGYAFPLNELAQGEPGVTDALPLANEVVASRHFRFGLVQDGSGYNRLAPRRGAPFLLRRFEVPRDWSGEQLLAHLERQRPSRLARLEQARVLLAENRPSAARRIVEQLAAEAPTLAPELEETLANIAWSESRPREAAAHLAAAPPRPDGARSDSADRFAERVAWRNGRGPGVETWMFADSSGRSLWNVGTTIRHPLQGPVDLELRVGELRVQEKGAPTVQGPEVLGSGAWAIARHVDAAGWARYRSIVGSSFKGGADLRLHGDHHALSLGFAREDVDTAAAMITGIGSSSASGSYVFQSPAWRAEGRVARREFDDLNWRNELHASVLRRFGNESRWAAGGSVSYEDSRFEPSAYWAPIELTQAFARMSYREMFGSASTLSADVRLGAGRDADARLRPAGIAQFRYSRWWGSQLKVRTTLEVQTRASPGYRSTNATLQLETRF